MREIGLIVLFAVVISFVYNAYSPSGLPLIRVAPKKVAVADSLLFSMPPGSQAPHQQLPAATDSVMDTVRHEKLPVFAPLHKKAMSNPDSIRKIALKRDTSYRTVTLDQVRRLMAERRGVIYDARSEEDFAAGHIPGAKNIPFVGFEKHFDEIMSYSQDTLIIVYCTGPDCELGRGLCDFLVEMKFRRVVLYDGGWEEWSKANLPVEGMNAKKKY